MTDGPPPRHLYPVDEEPPYDPAYDDHQPTRPPTISPDQLAERAVLAALLSYPETHDTIHQLVDAADFHQPVHQTIWETWHTLAEAEAVPPDLLTLHAALLKAKHTNAVQLIPDLYTTKVTPGLAHRYATEVRDHARLRVVDQLATGLRDIAHRGDINSVDTYLGEALQRLDETVMHFGPTKTGGSTGLADLTWILGGTPPTAEPPTWGQRADGTALFYAGRHNGVFGDPESGKTWLAQVAGVEAMNAGQCFAMIDVDHNGQNHTAARLMLLGANRDVLADPDRFRYYEPEDADQLRAAVHDITRLAPAVVVLDSIGEILPMLGVKSVDNDEITAALREVVMPPAKAGSCVISVDHLPKSAEARVTGYAIGGTAKKRAVDGAYLRAEAKVKPTPGGIGRIMLRIEKDRTGELRKSSGGGYAGTFTLDSTTEHVTTWTIGQDRMPTNADGSFRPTTLMQKVADYIADNDGCTGRDLENDIPGKSTWIRDAVKILVAEGHVARTPGPNRSQNHSLLIPYREAEDDHASPTE